MNQDAELIYELPEAHSDLGLCEQRGLIACDFVLGTPNHGNCVSRIQVSMFILEK